MHVKIYANVWILPNMAQFNEYTEAYIYNPTQRPSLTCAEAPIYRLIPQKQSIRPVTPGTKNHMETAYNQVKEAIAMFPWKRFLIGTGAIFLLGSGIHFLYDALGQSVLVAPISPVNESVWEHLKLLSTAAALWMIADWFLADKSARPGFFAARAIALPLGLVFIPAVYYLLKGGFGAEGLAIDILNFFAATALYQYVALRLEKKPALAKWDAAGLAVIAAIILLFAVLTFLPPHLPIFQDPETGGFGIA